MLHDAVVKILSSQMRVSVCGQHLEDAAVDREQRNVERSAAEVEDEDGLRLHGAVKAICDRRRGGLVQDSEYIEPSNRPCVFGGLPLRVVEVRGDRDDHILHLLAQVRLCRITHLAQDHGRDLLREQQLGLPLHVHPYRWLPVLVRLHSKRPQLHVRLHMRITKPPADKPLRVIHSVLRVEGRLRLRGIAHKPLSVGEGHVRRGHAVALVIRDDLHLAILEDAHT
mmetsp:Transcript_42723/g.106325  ORF Transcript_42723/g.106325 Transcript_42723/m.106325 type:complete len:225 (-) Transcript_42723:99-773(-)